MRHHQRIIVPMAILDHRTLQGDQELWNQTDFLSKMQLGNFQRIYYKLTHISTSRTRCSGREKVDTNHPNLTGPDVYNKTRVTHDSGDNQSVPNQLETTNQTQVTSQENPKLLEARNRSQRTRRVPAWLEPYDLSSNKEQLRFVSWW